MLKLPRLFTHSLAAEVADSPVAIPDSAPSILWEMNEPICLDARLVPRRTLVDFTIGFQDRLAANTAASFPVRVIEFGLRWFTVFLHRLFTQ